MIIYTGKLRIEKHKKINRLLEDIKKNEALQSLGKPEWLKHDQAGLYSRRLDEANRLIYGIDELQNTRIMSCKGHYKD